MIGVIKEHMQLTVTDVPSNLYATALRCDGATINWTNNLAGNNVVQISYSTNQVNWTNVNSTSGATSLVLTGLTQNTTYYVRARARISAGVFTDYSPIMAVTTVTAPVITSFYKAGTCSYGFTYTGTVQNVIIISLDANYNTLGSASMSSSYAYSGSVRSGYCIAGTVYQRLVLVSSTCQVSSNVIAA